MKNPTPSEVKEARISAGLTQEQAAKLVHVTRGAWAFWESGERKMSESVWELFLIKTKNDRQYTEDYVNISVNNYRGIR